MDNRQSIITETVNSLIGKFSADQLHALQDALYIQLNKYEITERCTEIALADTSPGQVLKKFIATKRIEGKSEKTLDQYALRCKDMLDTVGKPVDEITLYDLRFYLADFQRRRKVSNRTLENVRHCISAFFGWLYSEGIVAANPAYGIGSIKYEKQIRHPFTHEEMERIRRACTCKRDRAIVEFLYATGCRVSEVVSLDRDQIDFIRKQAVVTGKGSKQRVVYLDDVSIMYLTEYLTDRTDCDPCLFLGKCGRLSVSGIESMLHKLEPASGVSDIHPHRFRRTLASNMISRGANIQDVSTILGHESISTTQIYCAIDQENVQNAYHRCIA